MLIKKFLKKNIIKKHTHGDKVTQVIQSCLAFPYGPFSPACAMPMQCTSVPFSVFEGQASAFAYALHTWPGHSEEEGFHIVHIEPMCAHIQRVCWWVPSIPKACWCKYTALLVSHSVKGPSHCFPILLSHKSGREKKLGQRWFLFLYHKWQKSIWGKVWHWKAMLKP